MNTTVLTSVRLTRIRRKNFLPLKILVKYYLEREFERLLITYGLKSLTCYPPFLCGYTFLQLTFKRDAGERCVEVCKKKYSLKKGDDKKKLDFLKKGIKLNYQHHWYELKFSIVDGYLLVFFISRRFQDSWQYANNVVLRRWVEPEVLFDRISSWLLCNASWQTEGRLRHQRESASLFHLKTFLKNSWTLLRTTFCFV